MSVNKMSANKMSANKMSSNILNNYTAKILYKLLENNASSISSS